MISRADVKAVLAGWLAGDMTELEVWQWGQDTQAGFKDAESQATLSNCRASLEEAELLQADLKFLLKFRKTKEGKALHK